MDPINPNRPASSPEEDQSLPTEVRQSSRLLRKRVNPSEGEPELRLKKPRHHSDARGLLSRKSVQAEADWITPNIENNRIMIPAVCVQNDAQCRVDATIMQELATKVQLQEAVSHKRSGIAGMGAFANSSFRKHELIGFYKGRLMKHVPVSEEVLAHYKANSMHKDQSLPSTLYVAWHEDNGIHFMTTADTHVLWSGFTVSGTEVELGIDGLFEGNNLAYLNHSEHPNVMPLATINRTQSLIEGDNIYLKPGYTENDVLLMIVATEDIPTGAELTFNYNWTEKQIHKNFTLVGNDIFPEPEIYTSITGDEVGFNCGRQQKKALETKEKEAEQETYKAVSPLSSLPAELNIDPMYQQLATNWRKYDRASCKKIVDSLMQGDKDMLKLYIWLHYSYRSYSPSIIYKNLSCNGIKKYFDLTCSDDLRQFIRNNFSVDLASQINQQQRISTEVIDCRKQNKHADLFGQMINGRGDPNAAMKEYLFDSIYNSGNKALRASAQFLSAEKALSNKSNILGMEPGYWTKSRLYAFMVDHNLFKTEADSITYMPLKYLNDCFRNPEGNHGVEQGKKKFSFYVTQWLTSKKKLLSLQSELNIHEIYNPFTNSTSWTQEDLLKLPASRIFYRVNEGVGDQQMYKDLERDVETWLFSARRDPARHQALERIKISLQGKQQLFNWVVFYMRKLGKNSICDISEKTRNFTEGRDRIKSEGIRECIHKCFESDKSLSDEDKARFLEGYAFLAESIINKYQKEHPGQDVDDHLFDLLKDQLSAELRQKLNETSRDYMSLWISLLKRSGSVALLKIYVEQLIDKKGRVNTVKSLNQVKIRLPSKWIESDKKWSQAMITKLLSLNP